MGNKSSKKSKKTAEKAATRPPKAPSTNTVPGFMKPPPEGTIVRKKTAPSLKKASRRDSVKYNKDALEKRIRDEGATKRIGMTTEELLAKRKAAQTSNLKSTLVMPLI